MARGLLGLTETRLKFALLAFFCALALPTALLIAQAYAEAQWEAFQTLRVQADALAGAIDSELALAIADEERRGFADYSFSAGRATSASATPSSYPVVSAVPGLLGYFQVDSHGHFRTPVLPDPDHGLDPTGRLPPPDLSARAALGERLYAILTAPPAAAPAPAAPHSKLQEQGAKATDSASASSNVYDRLVAGASRRQQAPSSYGRLADLKFDGRLEQKIRDLERKDEADKTTPENRLAVADQLAPTFALERVKQRDAAPAVAADRAPAAEFAARAPPATVAPAAPAPAPQMQISKRAEPTLLRQRTAHVRLFEGELGPMTFEVLDEHYFVLFRNVWRDGERYVQGAVIERARFIEDAITAAFRASALAAGAALVIGWQDDVVGRADGGASATDSASALAGALLLRTRLSAPLASLDLLFSVTQLPLAPGGRYLLWVTLVLTVVLSTGCLLFYRLGRDQLRLQRQQQDFVSAVSHELKTPLTSIRMYSEILRAGWADDSKKASYYAYIHDESERLSRLIANVLELARMTHGQREFALTPLALGAALAEAEAKIASAIERGGFTLARTVPTDVAAAMVAVDVDAFVQILINLIDNAIKFTPADARKHIELSGSWTRDGKLAIGVRDYGRGVPPAHLRRIFDLFYRGGSELTRDTVGTGIGLALVREFASVMHGRVEVCNRDPGAEFTLVLPVG